MGLFMEQEKQNVVLDRILESVKIRYLDTEKSVIYTATS